MKRSFGLLLLIGALLGLIAQAGAYAAGPPASSTPVAAMQMDSACAEMMQKQQPAKDGQPCKGLMLDCIASMGCTVPFALSGPTSLEAAPPAAKADEFWPVTAVLIGSDRPPETHPPTILG